MKKVKSAERDGISDNHSVIDDFALIARAAIDYRHRMHSFNDLGFRCDVVDLVDQRLIKTVIFAIQGQQSLRGIVSRICYASFRLFCRYCEAS